ncbi:MAG: tyrosine-type recombinase/integrase [Alphaproteobacteria bacterium]|nr:tyrosine-type recombinase/integrase [Alphaproteobacteria bacterium]
MARITLTDARIKALKPGGELLDALLPGLIVRATNQGHKSYMLRARFPCQVDRATGALVRIEDKGKRHPTRRNIAEVGAVKLDEARDIARAWLAVLKRDIDPKEEEQQRLAQSKAERACTFEVVAEEYIRRRVKNFRQSANVERRIRRNLIPAWGNRPVTSIARRDVIELIEAMVDRGIPTMAHACFGDIRSLFNWAIRRDIYGLSETNPCGLLRSQELIGEQTPRQRVLSDDEIAAFWRATARLEYPARQLFRLILLTGTRRSEAAGMRWREIDGAAWTIPAARYKSKRQHLVPLSEDALVVLAEVPRFRKGDCVFTNSFGASAVHGFAKPKEKLDALMLDELRKTASEQGENPDEVKLRPWQTHDLRRTCRTRLSELGVDEVVAELTIGHTLPTLIRTYAVSARADERRAALEAWASLKGPTSSFSGGGVSGTISSGAGSTGLSSSANVEPARPTPTQITINLAPGRYSQNEVRDLIEDLNEAIGDGARLRVT